MNKFNHTMVFVVSAIIMMAALIALSACSSDPVNTPIITTPVNTAPGTTISPSVTSVITPTTSNTIPATTTITSGTTGPNGDTSVPVQNVWVMLTAQNMTFDKTSIAISVLSVGTQVDIEFHNQDAVTHNFSLYTDTSATKSLFIGDNVAAGQVTKYSFRVPETPGSYYFRCDLHPEMHGVLEVR